MSDLDRLYDKYAGLAAHYANEEWAKGRGRSLGEIEDVRQLARIELLKLCRSVTEQELVFKLRYRIMDAIAEASRGKSVRATNMDMDALEGRPQREASTDTEEITDAIADAMRFLDWRETELVRLIYGFGGEKMSLRAAAKKVGCSPATAVRVVRKALAKLKENLVEMGYDEDVIREVKW